MFRFRDKLRKNLANIPGWRTSRKIVVIESDDWGSVRIRDRDAYKALKKAGLNVDRYHYDSVESLESNSDLEKLFDLLTSFKDKNGKNPVITAMCLLGNPDFQKIKDSGYKEYYFEPLKETIKAYPASNNILNYWRKGKAERLFVPELHGREHINVRRYMEILQSHKGKEGLRIALDYQSVGPSAYNDLSYPNYLGALHPIQSDEIPELHQYVLQAGALFKDYVGSAPKVFIAPNAEEPKEIEGSLDRLGVRYLTRSRKRSYPKGDGAFEREFSFIGDTNEFGQIFLNRTAFFEPVAWGEHEHISDWVESCMYEIGLAFRWGKPAVISSHRVNYVGSISGENREKGLSALRSLLSKILRKWPDVEFMSSAELGNYIEFDRS